MPDRSCWRPLAVVNQPGAPLIRDKRQIAIFQRVKAQGEAGRKRRTTAPRRQIRHSERHQLRTPCTKGFVVTIDADDLRVSIENTPEMSTGRFTQPAMLRVKYRDVSIGENRGLRRLLPEDKGRDTRYAPVHLPALQLRLDQLAVATVVVAVAELR